MAFRGGIIQNGCIWGTVHLPAPYICVYRYRTAHKNNCPALSHSNLFFQLRSLPSCLSIQKVPHPQRRGQDCQCRQYQDGVDHLCRFKQGVNSVHGDNFILPNAGHRPYSHFHSFKLFFCRSSNQFCKCFSEFCY